MTLSEPLRQRLEFLARVIHREMQHLQLTDQRLFAEALDAERLRSLEQNPQLAETVDAFAARFGRLQDSVGDKLLPLWRQAVGETPGTAIDNLDRAERLGLIDSANNWLALRRLRKQIIHDYIEDAHELAKALQEAHAQVPTLVQAAHNLLQDLRVRGFIAMQADAGARGGN
ncbi:MAG: hypothetical protein U7M05_02260 [Candidatus Igneacidithiobacillus chanchocoensis]